MSVPKYNEMYKPYLELLMDGKAYRTKDLKQYISNYFTLTEEDTSEMLPSGRQTLFSNRLGWCRTYLKKAMLIDTISKFEVIITERGRQVYQSNEVITNATLSQFPEFCEFVGGHGDSTIMERIIAADNPESSETPRETMQRMNDQMNTELADEVLSMVLAQSPAFFEEMVVKLLEKMGYCKELNGHGRRTQSTNDGGIDGVIYQDRLGFDKIYIQAKKWNINNPVQRPDVQSFYGAMAGKHAIKGLFITTSRFTSGAEEYAAGQNIVLVDGMTLAELMIEYELGVTTEYVYKIKRIDTDFFIEE